MLISDPTPHRQCYLNIPILYEDPRSSLAAGDGLLDGIPVQWQVELPTQQLCCQQASMGRQQKRASRLLAAAVGRLVTLLQAASLHSSPSKVMCK